MLFCNERQISSFCPSINDFLLFLLGLFQGTAGHGLGFSALNTARSAVSTVASINNIPVGQHPLTKRFMKAAFNVKPVLPKTIITWDVDKVLLYLRSLSPVRSLSLYNLSRKLVTLLLLLSGQRGQTMTVLDIRNISISKSKVSLRIGELLKTSRPNFHQQELSFVGYAPDRRLCIIKVLNEYIDRTEPLRGSVTRLFITTRPPYVAVSRDTIARWTKQTLSDAGVDMTIFTPHSTRSASTSKAASNIPLDTIMKTAGWTQESTFSKYYKKDTKSSHSFDIAVLHGL